MRSLAAILADVLVLSGTIAIVVGVWSRFGWELASIIGGTTSLLLGVLAGRRSESKNGIS